MSEKPCKHCSVEECDQPCAKCIKWTAEQEKEEKEGNKNG